MRRPTSRNEHSDVIFTGEMAVTATACCMTVSVEMHNTGDPELQRDVVAIVEHVLSDRRGDWRVLIVGSQETDRWEMKVYGPNSFERSYTLEGSAGEHEPRAVGAIISKIAPANR
jgi:hypothetical protein